MKEVIGEYKLDLKLTVTEKNVTGASKKISPDTAIGSLFKAPTML